MANLRTTMSWKEDAIKNLHNSLHPVKVELNEFDWKSGLSEKSERLAQHISAFANLNLSKKNIAHHPHLDILHHSHI